jgi:hypothetical protein
VSLVDVSEEYRGVSIGVLREIIAEHKRLQSVASGRRVYRSARWNTPEALAKRAAWRRDWNAKNRKHNAAVRKAWRRRNLLKHLLYAAKVRAKKYGHAFSVTVKDLPPMGDRCPLLGHRWARPGARVLANTPSIDRINSRRGYVRGNVWVVGWRANLIKNDGTAAEHEAIARAMRERGAP